MFKRWSPAGRFADVPAEELVDGLTVRHPRFLFIPKVGRPLSPLLYAASLWPSVRALKGRVDVVLGCWAFPDGLAAILLARRLGAAAAIKVHGSDLNVLPQEPSLRRLLRWGLPRVDRLIAVSRPLGERAVELGVPRERVTIVENGIDREIFRPAGPGCRAGGARAGGGRPAHRLRGPTGSRQGGHRSARGLRAPCTHPPGSAPGPGRRRPRDGALPATGLPPRRARGAPRGARHAGRRDLDRRLRRPDLAELERGEAQRDSGSVRLRPPGRGDQRGRHSGRGVVAEARRAGSAPRTCLRWRRRWGAPRARRTIRKS